MQGAKCMGLCYARLAIVTVILNTLVVQHKLLLDEFESRSKLSDHECPGKAGPTFSPLHSYERLSFW